MQSAVNQSSPSNHLPLKEGVLNHDENSGKLYGWGSGEFAQHGHGVSGQNVSAESALVRTDAVSSQLRKLKTVACGASHTVVITENNETFSWGNSSSGQLGCGDRETHSDPQQVTLATDGSALVGVACGGRHTVWWSANGRCYSCGNNFFAQLGYDFRIPNYKENQMRPHLLRPIMHKKVLSVACGEKHTLFLYDTGIIAGCGYNSFGQLGNGTREELVSPRPLEELPEKMVTSVGCGSNHSLAATEDGLLYAWGLGRAIGSRKEDVLLPQQMKTCHANIVFVAGGSSHSMALSRKGTVYTWGVGINGQLGHGTLASYLHEPKKLPREILPTKVAAVTCGDTYSAVVTIDGEVWMWGKNSHVIFAEQPSSQLVYHPVKVTSDTISIKKLACGAWHSVAISGVPEWLPEEGDSSSGEDDLSSDEGHDLDSGAGSDLELSDEDEISSELRGAFKKKPAELFNTRMSLEEFYAPTPLPAIRPGSQLNVRRVVRKKSSLGATKEPEKYDPMKNNDCAITSAADCLMEYSDVEEPTSRKFSQNKCEEFDDEVKIENGIKKEDSQRIATETKESMKEARRQSQRTSAIQRAKTSYEMPINASKSSKVSIKGNNLSRGAKVTQKSPSLNTIGQSNVGIRTVKQSNSFEVYDYKSKGKSKVVLASRDVVMDYDGQYGDEFNRLPTSKMSRAHTLYGNMGKSKMVERGKTTAFASGDNVKSMSAGTRLPENKEVLKYLPKRARRPTQGEPLSREDSLQNVGSSQRPDGAQKQGNPIKKGLNPVLEAKFSIKDIEQEEGERDIGLWSPAGPLPERRAMFSSATSWRDRSSGEKDVLLANPKKFEGGS